MSEWSNQDLEFMARALSLARRGAGHTRPNPMVGAVVVSGGRVVGEGFHRRAGGPHAEPQALAAAGSAARGASLYVNLEPCCHHGRTPPCTDAIVAAGVFRVVAAMTDPDPRVAGRGIDALKAAGIDVQVGLMNGQARRLNEEFIKHVTTGLPFVVYKYAMTLDGKTATRAGDSRWISSGESRLEVHRLRGRLGAVMVGAGTATADDPRLTCRLEGDPLPQPWRVVVDTHARLSPLARVIRASDKAPAVVAVGDSTPADRIAALEGAGATVWSLPTSGGNIDLRALMARLGREGLTAVLLEGGGTLAASMLEGELVDKVVCFIAPRLAGGSAAPTPVGGEGVELMEETVRLRDVRYSTSGPDLVVEGYVDRRA